MSPELLVSSFLTAGVKIIESDVIYPHEHQFPILMEQGAKTTKPTYSCEETEWN
ncbi:MAG: hypothetical protein HXS41_04985 [Theionarchaea archaeon]|nr:hypothetical protein [Theionarchaea archaeon]